MTRQRHEGVVVNYACCNNFNRSLVIIYLRHHKAKTVNHIFGPLSPHINQVMVRYRQL